VFIICKKKNFLLRHLKFRILRLLSLFILASLKVVSTELLPLRHVSETFKSLHCFDKLAYQICRQLFLEKKSTSVDRSLNTKLKKRKENALHL